MKTETASDRIEKAIATCCTGPLEYLVGATSMRHLMHMGANEVLFIMEMRLIDLAGQGQRITTRRLIELIRAEQRALDAKK